MMDQLPYVEIPWAAFMKEEDKDSLIEDNREPIPLVPVTLNMEEDRALIAYFEERTAFLSEWLTDKSVYMDALIDPDDFNQFIEGTVQTKGSELLSQALLTALNETYSNPHHLVHSLTLKSLERVSNDKGQSALVTLTLNAMGDEEGFLSIPIILTIDESSEWIDVTIKDQIHSPNTERPLSHTAFFEDDLYERISSDVLQLKQSISQTSHFKDVNQTLKALGGTAEELGITVDENVKLALDSWVTHVGESGHVELTGFSHDDTQAKAESMFVLSISNADDIVHLHLKVDRTSNRILTIQKEETHNDNN